MLIKFVKRISAWLAKIDKYDRQAKQMRREDRLGEIDYDQLQQDYERELEERERSKLDA